MTQNEAASKKNIDVLVWGATGFTGRLVAEYLSTEYGTQAKAGQTGLRWALGGRNKDKLKHLAEKLGAQTVPIITAEAKDEAGLAAIVRRTKVVLTTVGPYQKYGSALVAACAGAGTDYVDLSGEPAWMRQMIDAHHDQARQTGARIVHSCGFDSIPFDLGVYAVQKLFRERYGTPASEVKGRVLAMRGGASGGTIASALATLEAAGRDPEVRKILANPYGLAPDPEAKRPRQPDSRKPHFDPDTDKWVAPFVMADINLRNIHRSNMLMNYAYGQDFQYSEMVTTKTAAAAFATAAGLGGVFGLLRFPPSRALLRKMVLPKPGDGPNRHERESGFYKILFLAKGMQGRTARVIVKGDRDPGYGSTSKMIAEAAICLALDVDKADQPGGVLTPAPAMAEELIARLTAHAGLHFEAT